MQPSVDSCPYKNHEDILAQCELGTTADSLLTGLIYILKTWYMHTSYIESNISRLFARKIQMMQHM